MVCPQNFPYILRITTLSPIFFLINLFIFWLRWIFIAVCGLFSSCSEQGLLFVAVRGLLIAVAFLAKQRALGAWASVVEAQ